MALPLQLAMLGLLYVLFFGALSFLRREGTSMRLVVEAILLTAVAVGTTALTGLDLNPAFFVVLLYLITMRVRLLIDLGNLLARNHSFAAAEQVYGLARRLGPDETGRLLVLLNEGVLDLHRGRADEAVAVFREVLAASESGYLGIKSKAACHYNLGVAYQRQGLAPNAVLEFNKVLDTWPVTEYARYARIALERHKRGTGADEANSLSTSNE